MNSGAWEFRRQFLLQQHVSIRTGFGNRCKGELLLAADLFLYIRQSAQIRFGFRWGLIPRFTDPSRRNSLAQRLLRGHAYADLIAGWLR